MYPRIYAEKTPDKAALIMGSSGKSISYKTLEEASNQLAHYLRSLGLTQGDSIAFLIENSYEYFYCLWAAQRTGLYYTPINTHLTAREVAYILEDCKATVFITTTHFSEVANELTPRTPYLKKRLLIGGDIEGYDNYEHALTHMPTLPVEHETEGSLLLYTSGTTGNPKGVFRPVTEAAMGEGDRISVFLNHYYRVEPGQAVYLSPAPLYHAAPNGFTTGILRLGGTVVIMEKYDSEQLLQMIEKYRVTHTQLVPTMFSRLLNLPEAVKKQYDLSSLTCVIHAAAPCPVPVKKAMIEWWGPIIEEYYGASEGIGRTVISSSEWLKKPGSVGTEAIGTLHIVGEDGNELPAGEVGLIYFEGGGQFSYLNDDKKTREAHNEKGWATTGDIGYVDEDGYLFLTDRKSHMIISGGVNIYPQESEDLLICHPKVQDAAVFGIPHKDFGEEVKAVVQLHDFSEASPALEAELLAYLQNNLAKIKCPKSIDFAKNLPRMETGKLHKRLLRDKYWEGHQTHII